MSRRGNFFTDKEKEVFLKDMGIAIRTIRKIRGLTLLQLHELSGVSITLLSELEKGKRNPSIITLLNLTCALNVFCSDFFPGVERFHAKRK